MGPLFIYWSSFANSFDLAEILACAKNGTGETKSFLELFIFFLNLNRQFHEIVATVFLDSNHLDPRMIPGLKHVCVEVWGFENTFRQF